MTKVKIGISEVMTSLPYQLELISPTRKQPYIIADLLKKALDRADVAIHFSKKVLYTSGYGDKDLIIQMIVVIGESVWSDSIHGTIKMMLPAHIRLSGVFDGFTWGCGESFGTLPPEYDKTGLECKVLAHLGEQTFQLSLPVEIMEEFARHHDSMLCEIFKKATLQYFLHYVDNNESDYLQRS